MNMDNTKEDILSETGKLGDEIAKLKEALEKASVLKSYTVALRERDRLKGMLESALKELESL